METIEQTLEAGAAKKARTAYFFLGRDAEGKFHGYPHEAILCAEGLQEMGWRIASDVTAWRPGPDEPFLFPGDPDGPAPKDCDLLVVSEDYFYLQGSAELPAAIVGCSVPAIFVDRRDLAITIRDLYSDGFRRFQAIFRTHGSKWFRHPKNVRQMVFGLSNRIAQASSEAAARVGLEPRAGLIWNFRHTSIPHSVRLWAEKEVRPLLEAHVPLQSQTDAQKDVQTEDGQYTTLMLQQTEGRHFPAYYERMARAKMAACFGGYFLLPIRQEESGPACRLGNRLMKSLGRPTITIAQWDSWRMWEAFAAGTAVLQADMDKCGFLFGGPRPEPMKHYIAVSTESPSRDLLPLLEDQQQILKIGEAGRAWAMEHYTSKPIAARILSEVGL